ncbi:hypothetical protein RHECNPAF_1740057 [Rhizobium etli CNPAF512]|nr:hypothetical protein RHECNPAF_1740057 [Rhizobium etli CNPAF512]
MTARSWSRPRSIWAEGLHHTLHFEIASPLLPIVLPSCHFRSVLLANSS